MERTRIDEFVEAIGLLRAEQNVRQSVRHVLFAGVVAKHELRAAIFQDGVDGLAREAIIHRHGDKAGAHDAEIGGDELGAVHRQDGDAVAALQPPLCQRARHSHRHRIELGIGELARRGLPAQVDDRDLGEVAIARDQVAEIVERAHGGAPSSGASRSCLRRRRVVGAAPARQQPMLRVCYSRFREA